MTQADEVRSGGSYLSQNDVRIHFGLASSTRIDSVEIRWPSGAVDHIGSSSATTATALSPRSLKVPVLMAGLAALIIAGRAPETLESFWKPLLSSRAPVLLCIGNVEGGEQPPAADDGVNSKLTLSDFQNSPIATVNEFDSFALAKFAGLLQANGRQFKFASQSDATFSDLQSGPAILVGLLNNNWTERLVPKLRYTVDQPIMGKFVIRDRSNPSNNDWSVDYSTPYLKLTKDYALVLRMVDPKTEQTVIVAAGITVFGTSAASDFLTSPKEIQKLSEIAPPGWEKKNLELVLSTDVIRGQSGPASIVAAQFW